MIARLRGLPAAVAALAAAAVVAVWRSTDGRYVGDNRFEQYWEPGWRLVRETSLWDGTRGMGRVGEELWPLTLPLAWLRGIGLSPVATQQVWHAVVLTVAATGVVVLLRTAQPRVGLTHVVAGLAYAASPYALTFLLPTNLFWSFALAPWLLAVAWRGMRGPRPWRWAAVWALLVATGGDTDPPGLLLAAAWVVPLVAYVVWVEREATMRQALAWLGRAGLLTLWVDLAALVKVRLGSGPLAQRLLTTEGVVEVNQTSSWTESWRGLGYWVTYFTTPGRDGDLPGAVAWYESVGGVLLTFAVPVVALVALWRLRWRPRLLWGALATFAVVVMVGSNGSAGRSPVGRALLGAYDAVPSLASFRTTYKAGSGLILGVAVLAATGASAWGATLARRDRRLRVVPLAVLASVVVAAAVPLWSGELYAPDRQVRAVAPHWEEAAEWIEAQPGDARVLVLPGSTQTAYRWGWVGDDILDSLLRRHPNVVPTNFPVSSPLTADIVDALARRLDEGRLDATELAAVARRLGVGWVLVRNDMDWERMRVPRPDALDPLRDDDALPLARTFGDPGEDTTDPDDTSRAARREAELPPIEVYAVPGVDGTQRLTRAGDPALLLDGAGDAWPIMAGLGLLDGDRAVRHAGGLTDDQLAEALEGGAPVVVTDTNRRRLTLIRGPGPTSSELLPADGDPGPVAPADLFGAPGTQTVATYTDATAIEVTGDEEDLGGFSPWFRPAHAYDRDVGTSWRVAPQDDPEGIALVLRLAEATPVEHIRLVPLRTEGRLRRITEVSVDRGDGARRVELDPDAPTEVAWDAPLDTTAVTVTITAVEGDGDAAVGLAEVEVDGVDARERVTLPDHLTDSDDPAVRAALAEAPVSYVLTRSGVARTVDDTRFDEERSFRRAFTVTGERTFTATGTVAGGRDLTDRAVDALLGGPVGAWGTSRPTLPSEGRGGLAVDGDPATGWVGQAREGEALTVRFPRRPVDRVTVRIGAGPSDVPLDEVLVTVGGREPVLVATSPEEGCEGAACPRIAVLEVPDGQADRVEVGVTADVRGQRRVRILEVEVDGREGPVPPAGDDVSGCGRGIVAVDDAPVPVRIEGATSPDVLDDPQVPVTACTPLDLGEGEHTVDSVNQARIEQVVLTTDGLPATVEAGAAGTASSRGPASLTVDLDGTGEVIALTGQSYDAGWEARADGGDLGTPIEVDGQTGWPVAAASGPVDMAFGPQRTYRAALFLSLLGVAVCLVLAIGPPRRRVATLAPGAAATPRPDPPAAP